MALLAVKGINLFPSSNEKLKGTIDVWWIVHILFSKNENPMKLMIKIKILIILLQKMEPLPSFISIYCGILSFRKISVVACILQKEFHFLFQRKEIDITDYGNLIEIEI